ncbi:peptidoglycan-associated lipoprotein Pal [Pleionea sp. CnH1-48]|uniref:peptidoglycan-associated lipoprotein Pal n=1 Tax=Pleionea sp. CnH1-48 TaxID=2954494 RepID=UPI002098211D|nr:peptidoglycan-associated lipoprotein Pal [Pleionea sp. CnH1-48]MCO7224776.1 peptidoglycan-associated lipoprotein Pal [Pleionea sp. CnH1-48]
MSIKQLGKSLILTLPALFMVACSTTNDGAEDSQQNTETSTETTVETPVDTTPQETEADRLERINAETRAQRTVYFEFDDSTVSTSSQDLLKAHAWFLSKNPGISVVVEGHCDERGTPEYNLALGERRGKSVKDVLISYGVNASQVRVVSYGEEKPANPAHTESAWSKNRRAVLDYEG